MGEEEGGEVEIWEERGGKGGCGWELNDSVEKGSLCR